jgi:hypothetical protein
VHSLLLYGLNRHPPHLTPENTRTQVTCPGSELEMVDQDLNPGLYDLLIKHTGDLRS